MTEVLQSFIMRFLVFGSCNEPSGTVGLVDRAIAMKLAPWLLFSVLHLLATIVLIWLTSRCLRRASR